MSEPRLLTRRLELVAVSMDLVQAELRASAQLAEALQVKLPAHWPPPLVTKSSLEWTVRCLQDAPHRSGWLAWYWIRQCDRMLIGLGGFKGCPSCDGQVEIGYSVVPPYQGNGYATGATKALIEWAFVQKGVDRVVAETLPNLKGSIRVLEKNRFTHGGRGNYRGSVRFELRRDTASPPNAPEQCHP